MSGKLVIFDLDGTILDTLEDLRGSLNMVLSRHQFPPRTIDETRQFVGNGIRNLITRGAPEGTEEALIDAMFSEFLPYYKEHCAEKTAPYPEIPMLLQKLREEGYLTAVVSNKADPAVQELCRHYFPELFDTCVGEKPDVARKPAPDTVFEVLRHLEVSAGDAVYIGDSDVDILTAQNAKLPFIGVDWGFRGRAFLNEHGADAVAKDPKELHQMIKEILPAEE